MTNLFNYDFLEFLELLGNHEVDYLLVGGYAVILNGYVRSTGDLDLWVNKSKENYTKLVKVYSDFGAPIFPFEEFDNDKFDVWSIGVEPTKIEVLTHVDGLNFYDSSKSCNYLKIQNLKIPYINYDDLLKNKEASGRYKDLADIEQLKKNRKE